MAVVPSSPRTLWGVVNRSGLALQLVLYRDGKPDPASPMTLPAGSIHDFDEASAYRHPAAVGLADFVGLHGDPLNGMSLSYCPGDPTMPKFRFCATLAQDFGNWAFGGFVRWADRPVEPRYHGWHGSNWCRMLEPWPAARPQDNAYLFISGDAADGRDLRVNVVPLAADAAQAWHNVRTKYQAPPSVPRQSPPAASARTLYRIENHSPLAFDVTFRDENGGSHSQFIASKAIVRFEKPVPVATADIFGKHPAPHVELAARRDPPRSEPGFSFRFAASPMATSGDMGGWLFGGFVPVGAGPARHGPGAELRFPLQSRIMDPWPANAPESPVFTLVLWGEDVRGADFHPVVVTAMESLSPSRPVKGLQDGSDGGGDGGGGGGDGSDGGGGDDDDPGRGGR